MVTLRSVRNRRVHGDFENIFAFETHLVSHTNKSKDKTKSQGSRPQRIRALDTQANQTIYTTEHKLKYPEAS